MGEKRSDDDIKVFFGYLSAREKEDGKKVEENMEVLQKFWNFISPLRAKEKNVYFKKKKL